MSETIYRESDAWEILKRKQMDEAKNAAVAKVATPPGERKLSPAEVKQIIDDFRAEHPETKSHKILVGGTAASTGTGDDPYNAKKCPACGSDRRSTALQVNMMTPNGDFAGRAACRNAWHKPKQSDARLGFGVSEPWDRTR